MAASQLRIASRRSQLAMVQTHWVRDELAKAHEGLEITIEAMATQGDKILDVALAKIGDKGLFTKELEAQMLVDQPSRPRPAGWEPCGSSGFADRCTT